MNVLPCNLFQAGKYIYIIYPGAASVGLRACGFLEISSKLVHRFPLRNLHSYIDLSTTWGTAQGDHVRDALLRTV